VSPTQSTIAVNPGSITAGGGASQITVTARDAGGNPISGLTVVLGVTGAATLTQPATATGGTGQATGSLSATVAGSKIVSATVGGTLLAQTATVTVIPGAPLTMEAVTTTSPTITFGTLVSPSPSVRVRDAFSNVVPSVTVSFTILAGGSTRSPASVATDVNGIATVSSWLISSLFTGGSVTNTYTHTLRASATGTNTISFSGTARVRLSADLVPFFQTRDHDGGCTSTSCHGDSPQVPNFYSATLHTFLTTGTRYVIVNDSISGSATTNLLWRKPSGAVSHSGGTFASSVVTAIKAWIAQGAPNN
jgi:hypothetical protein